MKVVKNVTECPLLLFFLESKKIMPTYMSTEVKLDKEHRPALGTL